MHRLLDNLVIMESKMLPIAKGLKDILLCFSPAHSCCLKTKHYCSQINLLLAELTYRLSLSLQEVPTNNINVFSILKSDYIKRIMNDPEGLGGLHVKQYKYASCWFPMTQRYCIYQTKPQLTLTPLHFLSSELLGL